MPSRLFFGDNLWHLREHVATESVDLVYLDPPFNSKASYNVLFKSREGVPAEAQFEAFRDTWHWGPSAEQAYDEVMMAGGPAAGILAALRSFLGDNDMMAYLAMMTVRLVEMHRVLKPTGSLYLHCDPTASHYLKIVMDGIFGATRFQNEITWKRTSSHNDSNRFGRISDRLLFFAKTNDKRFFVQRGRYSDIQLARYRNQDQLGWYRAENLTAPHFSPTRTIEWRGTHPGARRQWRYSIDRLEELWQAGRILTRNDGSPRKDGLKVYLHEAEGQPLQDLWIDINVGPTSRERLGYPTQKPQALLERILMCSSEPGDVVLDPFCGCGTAAEAAQKLGRQWIGIDVTHYAVTLIEERVRANYPDAEIEIGGRPQDFEAACELARRDKYQFQFWANWLVGVQNYRERKKGADRGVDGVIFFRNGPYGTGRTIVSVKGGDNVAPSMVRDLRGTVEREAAQLGVLVTLAEPSPKMVSEAASAGYVTTAQGRFPRLQIVTVRALLDGVRPDMPRPYHAQAGELVPTKAKKQARKGQLSLPLQFQGGKTEQPADVDAVWVDPHFAREALVQPGD